MAFDNKSSWLKPFSARRYKAQFLNAKFIPHQREFHTLAFLAEGQFNVRYRERNHLINTGDSVLIPAGEIYSFDSEKDVKSIVYFHYFDTTKVYQCSNNQLLPDIENILITKKSAAALSNFLFANLDADINNSHYEQLLCNLVTELNATLVKSKKLNNELVTSLCQAQQHITDDMFQNFNLEELSIKCNIDKWQLSRNFKLFFGISLFTYIHACRIVKAKELLSYQIPISEVAYECQYADQSHLTRFFKRLVGITPNQWLKLMMNS